MKDVNKINKYLIGDLHQSHLVIIVSLFFGAVGVGFALINETQYAFACLIIATVISKFTYRFNQMFEQNDAMIAFGLELDVLARFVVSGLLPATLLIKFTGTSVWGLFLAAVYMLAVAMRLAYFNRGVQFQDNIKEGYSYGVPLEFSAIVLPLISLLGYVIPLEIFRIIYAIVTILLGISFILKIPIRKMPLNAEFIVMAILLVLAFIIIWLGSLLPNEVSAI